MLRPRSKRKQDDRILSARESIDDEEVQSPAHKKKADEISVQLSATLLSTMCVAGFEAVLGWLEWWHVKFLAMCGDRMLIRRIARSRPHAICTFANDATVLRMLSRTPEGLHLRNWELNTLSVKQTISMLPLIYSMPYLTTLKLSMLQSPSTSVAAAHVGDLPPTVTRFTLWSYPDSNFWMQPWIRINNAHNLTEIHLKAAVNRNFVWTALDLNLTAISSIVSGFIPERIARLSLPCYPTEKGFFDKFTTLDTLTLYHIHTQFYLKPHALAAFPTSVRTLTICDIARRFSSTVHTLFNGVRLAQLTHLVFKDCVVNDKRGLVLQLSTNAPNLQSIRTIRANKRGASHSPASDILKAVRSMRHLTTISALFLDGLHCSQLHELPPVTVECTEDVSQTRIGELSLPCASGVRTKSLHVYELINASSPSLLVPWLATTSTVRNINIKNIVLDEDTLASPLKEMHTLYDLSISIRLQRMSLLEWTKNSLPSNLNGLYMCIHDSDAQAPSRYYYRVAHLPSYAMCLPRTLRCLHLDGALPDVHAVESLPPYIRNLNFTATIESDSLNTSLAPYKAIGTLGIDKLAFNLRFRTTKEQDAAINDSPSTLLAERVVKRFVKQAGAYHAWYRPDEWRPPYFGPVLDGYATVQLSL